MAQIDIVALSARVDELVKTVRDLTARVEELEGALNEDGEDPEDEDEDDED